ncbi:hypothetical protein GCM10010341_67710 [Streptomyces noursei]|nr:hypothetical protein GCM10010341_67710 [Streptomyces noursei]
MRGCSGPALAGGAEQRAVPADAGTSTRTRLRRRRDGRGEPGQLAAGAAEVLLFADLANPTSNGLYQRIGYRPVTDFAVYDFSRAAQDIR